MGLLLLCLNLGFISLEFDLRLLLLERIRDSRSRGRDLLLHNLLLFSVLSDVGLALLAALRLEIRNISWRHHRHLDVWLHNLIICRVLAWLLNVGRRLLHLYHNRLLLKLHAVLR